MSPAKMLLFFFIIAINVAIVLQAPPMSNHPPIQGTGKPSFYKLVLQWGNSFCRDYTGVSCRQPVPQEFTVHGLWPYDQRGNMIICSAGPDLQTSDVHDIGGLNENWPCHLARRSYFSFWRQEWLKHGRCTGLKPREYFQKAVDLKKQIDGKVGGSLVQFSRDKGFAPDEKKRYDPYRFLLQINIKTSFATEMQCNVNKAGVYQLYEIRFCFTSNWNLRNCRTHNRPAYSRSKPEAKIYGKKKGPNSQKRSPPPPPPPPPSYHIGMCFGKGPVLFPARVPVHSSNNKRKMENFTFLICVIFLNLILNDVIVLFL